MRSGQFSYSEPVRITVQHRELGLQGEFHMSWEKTDNQWFEQVRKSSGLALLLDYNAHQIESAPHTQETRLHFRVFIGCLKDKYY